MKRVSRVKKCSGTQFDPDIVKEFVKVIKNNISFL